MTGRDDKLPSVLVLAQDGRTAPLRTLGRTPLSYAAKLGYMDTMKLLLERGDINPNSRDWDGRTPLSLAAERGNERIGRLLLERGDVNPNSADRNGLTPLAYATKSNHFGIMRLLSESLNHRTLKNNGVAHQKSAPTLGTQEEIGLAPISQRGGVILDIGREITEATTILHSDDPPLNPFEARPLSSALTSTPISDLSTNSTTLNPSRPLKRPAVDQPPRCRSKRKRLPSS